MSGSNYTQTPNYALYKPVVNADNDTWGSHLNANADTLDALIKSVQTSAGVSSVNTRTGAVVLGPTDISSAQGFTSYNATNPAGYVNATAAGAAAPVQSVAGRTGAVTLNHGDINDWATSLAPYAPLASPAFTSVPTAPTAAPATNTTQVATCAFVAAAVASAGGGASVTVGASPPASPNVGALWWDSVGALCYIWYDDGNSKQWVDINNASNTAPATVAPLPNTGAAVGTSGLFARQDHQHPAAYDIGRNVLHNGLFRVQQRAQGPWTANAAYTADRWQISAVTDAMSWTIAALTDADRTAIGDEEARYALQNVFTGSSAAGAFNETFQRIERVPRLSGKTVVVSFWALRTAGTAAKIGVCLGLEFGSGGSPSGAVFVPGQAIAIGTAWARYTATFVMPSAAGKVLGTNGDDSTQLEFWFSDAGASASRSGNIGVQSGTVQLWGVQLEVAQPGQTQPSPLDKPDIRYEMSNAQRFYCVRSSHTVGGACVNSAMTYLPYTFPVQMRAAPTVIFSMSGGGGYSGPTTVSMTPDGFCGAAVGTSGSYIANVAFTASADL